MKKTIYILLPVLVIASLTGLIVFKKEVVPDNIFLITLDTTRADFIKYTRENNRLTPNIAALAEEGIVFDNAYGLIPITLPSHSNMFYSLPPHVLKIYNNGQPKNVPFPSLTQLLKNKGYQTGAVVSLGVVKGEFGLNKGFDDYVENFKRFFWYKSAEEVNRDAFALIDKNKDKKGFYWIHYSDPHEPYYPPYFGGHFEMAFNGEKIFACKSIDRPLVNVELELKPGKNTVDLKNRVPIEIKRARKLKVGFFAYQNLSITCEEHPGDLEVVTPEKWKEVRVRGKKNYYSRNRDSQRDSQVVLVNKGKQNIKVRVKFLYRMLERPRSRKSLYRKEIRYMDRQLGKLIDFIKEKGMYENSVFMIVGDHGEGLGEYIKHYGHIHYLHKVYTHVPLILFGKGIEARGNRQELVSTLNVAPTLLDLAGVKKPDFMRGDSLLGKIKPRRLLLETYSPEAYFDAFSIIHYPYQVHFFPGRQDKQIEFTNIDSPGDFWGVVDIKDTMKDGKLKAELINEILKISRIITATKGKLGTISERHREILDSLGYL